MIVAAVLLAAGGLVLLSRSANAEKPDTMKRLRHLGSPEQSEDREPRGFGGTISIAFLLLPYRVLPERLGRLVSTGIDTSSDATGSLRTDLLAGARIRASIGAPFAILLILRFSPASMALAGVSGVLGALLPEIIIRRKRCSFEESVMGALPQFADILFALILGGKNLDQGFAGAAALAREPLAALLNSAVNEMELGASRSEAFSRVTNRCQVKELASLLRSLIEAEKRGHELSVTLDIYSREIRARRRDQLRCKVAKTPIRMLVPLVFLILPSAVLLTVGPTFLATIGKIL